MAQAKHINIFGAGVMGQQMAALFVFLGYHVCLHTRKDVQESKILGQAKLLRRLFKSEIQITGSVELQHYTDISSHDRVQGGMSMDALAEDIGLKRALYEKVRQHNNELFLTNTSSLSPMEIGTDVVGMHFFNPLTIQMVETTDCPNEFKATLKAVIDDLGLAGFQCIEVQSNRGYIGNKILFGEISNVLKLIEKDGYSTSDISAIYEHLYPNRNIFNIVDLIGVDIVKMIMENLAEDDNGFYVGHCLETAVSRDILGKKNRTSILEVFDH